MLLLLYTIWVAYNPWTWIAFLGLIWIVLQLTDQVVTYRELWKSIDELSLLAPVISSTVTMKRVDFATDALVWALSFGFTFFKVKVLVVYLLWFKLVLLRYADHAGILIHWLLREGHLWLWLFDIIYGFFTYQFYFLLIFDLLFWFFYWNVLFVLQ